MSRPRRRRKVSRASLRLESPPPSPRGDGSLPIGRFESRHASVSTRGVATDGRPGRYVYLHMTLRVFLRRAVEAGRRDTSCGKYVMDPKRSARYAGEITKQILFDRNVNGNRVRPSRGREARQFSIRTTGRGNERRPSPHFRRGEIFSLLICRALIFTSPFVPSRGNRR